MKGNSAAAGEHIDRLESHTHTHIHTHTCTHTHAHTHTNTHYSIIYLVQPCCEVDKSIGYLTTQFV